MKKFFTFVAAVMVALSMNAQYEGFDVRDGSLGQKIYDMQLLSDIDNIVLNETDVTAHKYEIKNENSGECSFYLNDIEFWYNNSNAGTIAFKSYGTYIQPNGNKRKVTIPVTAGQTVYVYVQDAISGVGLEGATVTSIDLEGWGSEKEDYNAITAAATSTEIVMWSDDRTESYTAAKFKLGAILYNVATGIQNNATAVKATKMIVNGEIVIRKNGQNYNLVGARL